MIADNWTDVWQKQHARAFTVAKAAKLSVLHEIRIGLDKALADGITEREFIKTLKPRLKKMGWWGKDELKRQLGSTRRLKTIFRTNMASSYNAGRYREQKRRAELKIGARPYWQYIAVLDNRTRHSHRELNGKVFRHDDPFWDSFYPPNGYNCRCRVSDLSARDVERQGLKVEKTNKDNLKDVPRTVRIVRVGRAAGEVRVNPPSVRYRGKDVVGKPFTIQPSPGFSYNAGQNWPRWDPLAGLPDKIGGKPRRGGKYSAEVAWIPDNDEYQLIWKDYGLNSWAARRKLPDAPKVDEGVNNLDAVSNRLLGDKARRRMVETPVEDIEITRDSLAYFAGKTDGRQKYVNFIVPTLEEADEVWLVYYPRDKAYRKRYLKAFHGEGGEHIIGIVRENADGTLFFNALKTSDLKYMDRQRRGALLYRSEE
ncbi:MAG: phage minor head protein [Gammaproteobacteria bacterium]|nr:phage minor head protein [Gammaproteobacteria bacterium]